MDALHLIAGLGNPGPEYAATRHNAGFLVLDTLARRWQVEWQSGGKFAARLARRTDAAGRPVLLCQPMSYMNCSGEVVGPLAAYYRIPPERLLVVVDDADLPLGQLRLRPGGGSGGHHGLASIIAHLGTTTFARQRVGIGRQGQAREITGHVLGRFSPAELTVMERVRERAADQLECWLREGLDRAMNRFNGAETGSTNEGTEP
jgi:PTH1 family peptidyl-tRNA hydrolase